MLGSAGLLRSEQIEQRFLWHIWSRQLSFEFFCCKACKDQAAVSKASSQRMPFAFISLLHGFSFVGVWADDVCAFFHARLVSQACSTSLSLLWQDSFLLPLSKLATCLSPEYWCSACICGPIWWRWRFLIMLPGRGIFCKSDFLIMMMLQFSQTYHSSLGHLGKCYWHDDIKVSKQNIHASLFLQSTTLTAIARSGLLCIIFSCGTTYYCKASLSFH